MSEQAKQTVPQMRFRGFDDDWKPKSLAEIASLTSSKRVYLSDYVPSGIPFYRGKEISELRQGIKPTDILYISDEAYQSFKNRYGAPKQDDILITAVGTLGNTYRVANDTPFYFKDGNLIWLRDVTACARFLDTYFQYKKLSLIHI